MLSELIRKTAIKSANQQTYISHNRAVRPAVAKHGKEWRGFSTIRIVILLAFTGVCWWKSHSPVGA